MEPEAMRQDPLLPDGVVPVLFANSLFSETLSLLLTLHDSRTHFCHLSPDIEEMF